ncbi:DUF305 domain-containing protein [Micromonospora rifamycinica]|uniref:DUF305 domain-containing protein n=1 Tax=Micromonospora rifamycinica TaxID=291594 RepID=UPI002E28B46F|nr:DUF305 domain-containing protein [Micromonospora rifamycinica]
MRVVERGRGGAGKGSRRAAVGACGPPAAAPRPAAVRPPAPVRCLAVALVVVSLSLAGCAAATRPVDPPHPAATGSGPPAAISGIDLVFLNTMTAHQERTLAILRVAPERIRQPALRTLVAAVEVTEADEVARAREWIRAADPDAGHRHKHPGPTGVADPVARLRGTSGPGYDAALVAVLASQQRQAAELARAHLALAVSPVVRDLARRIDASRTAQLRLLAGLPVARPTP